MHVFLVSYTRKYMYAETLALLTKLLCVPNMKYYHGSTIILRIVLKLTNPPKMINFPNIYMLGMLLYVI
jgi:hypothetical protein